MPGASISPDSKDHWGSIKEQKEDRELVSLEIILMAFCSAGHNDATETGCSHLQSTQIRLQVVHNILALHLYRQIQASTPGEHEKMEYSCVLLLVKITEPRSISASEIL